MIRHLFLAAALLTTSPALASDPTETALTSDIIERLKANESALLERVRTMAPDRHQELMVLQDTDQRAYFRALLKVARHLKAREGRGQSSPEHAALRRQLADIRAEYPDGIDDLPRKERNDVRAEIEGIASQIFDLKQAERRERIQQLRAALTEPEADVTLRDAERNKRIDDFIEDFLRGPVDL